MRVPTVARVAVPSRIPAWVPVGDPSRFFSNPAVRETDQRRSLRETSIRPRAREAAASPAGGPCGRSRCVSLTRNETIRTLAGLLLEEVLQDSVPSPAYQRLAPRAAELRAQGQSDHSTAIEFGVTDKTIAKAIWWFLAQARSSA